MIASRSRKSDAVLILLGVVILVLLSLAVVLLVRRQPQIAPHPPGTAAVPVAVTGEGAA